MKLRLEEPVEYGDLRLAPTVELAGLAELSEIRDNDARVEALLRIASAMKDEDDAREHLAAIRSGAIDLTTLPRRH
ncbi:MAG: hypothetical protein HYX32_14700 [Actinobacteria bacterium]|nr:hypothetical protein [Actinomycetota bacterium]